MLEPAGTVEIKFRRKDLVKAMHRLDAKCQEIAQALASAGKYSLDFSGACER